MSFKYIKILGLVMLIIPFRWKLNEQSYLHDRTIASFPVSKVAYLDMRSLSLIAKVTFDINRTCSKNDCIFVDIGRSPTPFAAYFEYLKKPHLNLPLNSVYFREFAQLYSDGDEEKIEAHNEALNRYLEKFIAENEEKLRGKRIVFYDFVTSGKSLWKFREMFLNLANKSLGRFENSQFVALVDEKYFEQYKYRGFDNLVGIPDEMMYLFYSSYFDQYAQFESFNPAVDKAPIPINDKFASLVRWMREVNDPHCGYWLFKIIRN